MRMCGFTDEAAPDIMGQVAVLKELGWNSMELRTVDGISIHDMDKNSFNQVKKILDEQGVSVTCLGSTIANWGKPINAPFKETKDAVKRAVERMKLLGVPYIRIMSYALELDQNGKAKEDQHIEERYKRLREICSMFLDNELVPVHENCLNYGGMSWEHSLELVEKIPGLKLVYDTGNPEMTPDFRTEYPYKHQDPWEFYDHVKEYISHVHIKDGVYDFEKHKEIYCFPGEGNGAVLRIITDLLKRGYNGAISIEPHMTVVFHDDSVKSDRKVRYDNFIEYGKRCEALIDQAKKEVGL
jgi:sugar phosphate isomerase/epimerase